jgi:hypothetical protein
VTLSDVPHSTLLNQFKVAMLSDILLIFLPLRTLRVLKNQPSLRRRLQFMFAASALTTCASIATGVFNWLGVTFWYIIVVELEVHIFFPTLLALLTVCFTFPGLALPHSLQFSRPR